MPGPRVRQCPLCAHLVDGPFGPGPGGRPNASCPRCGSLERHRFLALLLEGLTPFALSSRVVLDVAPSRSTTNLLDRMGARHVVRMDFDPAADRRAVNLRASLTTIPLPTGSVDLMICFHVLEHVPDDAAALREIARVLSPGGLALVQVPWRPASVTDEDPSADAAERTRRFGQADHVRFYGADVEDRVLAGGLDSLRVTPATLVGDRITERFGLTPDEAVWLLRRAAAPTATARVLGSDDVPAPVRTPVDDVLLRDVGQALDRSREDLEQLRDDLTVLLAQERAARAHWESAYRRLRSRWPLRAAAAARSGLRRATGR